MELSELKLVFASNLIRLRIGAGMTQAELGAKLNYSDKSVSKWERGDAIPDAWVLTKLSELFGVSVDYLLSSHDAWVPPDQEDAGPQYSRGMIYAVAIVGVWTMALTGFVVLWWIGLIWWQAFFVALTASALVYLGLSIYFKRLKNLQYMLAALVLSIFLLIYVFTLPLGNNWQLFLIAVPAEVLVFLACNIRIRKRPRRKKAAAAAEQKPDGNAPAASRQQTQPSDGKPPKP